MFTASMLAPTAWQDPEKNSMRASLSVEDVSWTSSEAVYEWRGPSNDPAVAADSCTEAPALGSAGQAAPDIPLSSEALRAIYVQLPHPDVARLITEIYRLRGLARRAALFADTATSRGSEKRLDVTSRTLFTGLAAALRAEPYVADHRLPPIALQTGVASRYRPASAYRAAAFAAASPESETNAEPASTRVKREKLFTWRLVPQPGRGDQMWRASRYRGLVVARAGDPIQARELAAERFSADVSPGIDRPGIESPGIENPWRMRRLVRVELMGNSPFDRVEQPGVVYP